MYHYHMFFRILTEMLQENPTYHNTSLLKLVTRFRCYVSYTFNLPGVNLALEESELQDPVIKAWVALIDNSTEILTFEYVRLLCYTVY